jgi:hypothetical protein
MAEVFHEDGVDAKNAILISLRLDYVADRKGAHVAPILEIARIQGPVSDFVEDASTFSPRFEDGSRVGRICARDVFVFVVLLGSTNDAVLDYIANDLSDLTLRKGDVHDEAHPVLSSVFFSAESRTGGKQEEEKDGERRGPKPPLRTQFCTEN